PLKPAAASLSQPGVAVPLFPPPPAARRELSGASPRRDAAAPAPSQKSASPPSPRAHPEPAAALPQKPTGPASRARFALDRELFPVLSSLGHNLSLAAVEGQLEEVVGRDDEIEKLLDILAKRHANSPCVVGPAGVGKTSVVRGLAHRFARDA